MARIKKAIFKFKPFSLKQKKVLTWWMPNSPVHDADGIIADGAIRSGKTLSMSLSFVFWAMTTFDRQNFRDVRQDDRILPEKRAVLAQVDASVPRL